MLLRNFVAVILLVLIIAPANAVVERVGGADAFMGLSTDTKPMTLEAGSKFFETDTGHVYQFDGDSWARYVDVDDYSGAVGNIDQEHLMIHEGLMYTVSARMTIANAGGTFEFLASVPAGVYPHFRTITIATDGGPIDVDLYGGTTTTADGTPVTAVNNNQASSNTASTSVFHTPTITTDGTLLEAILIPGNKQTGSLGSEASNEWVLQSSTKYMIRITNNTTGAGTSEFTINISFYEG